MKHKVVKFSIIVGILLIVLLYFMLDAEEFKEMWEAILGIGVLYALWQCASDYCKLPADRTRNTIDWEMEQEEKKRQEEEEYWQQRNKG